jgi:hypothetical protein
MEQLKEIHVLANIDGESQGDPAVVLVPSGGDPGIVQQYKATATCWACRHWSMSGWVEETSRVSCTEFMVEHEDRDNIATVDSVTSDSSSGSSQSVMHRCSPTIIIIMLVS